MQAWLFSGFLTKMMGIWTAQLRCFCFKQFISSRCSNMLPEDSCIYLFFFFNLRLFKRNVKSFQKCEVCLDNIRKKRQPTITSNSNFCLESYGTFLKIRAWFCTEDSTQVEWFVKNQFKLQLFFKKSNFNLNWQKILYEFKSWIKTLWLKSNPL